MMYNDFVMWTNATRDLMESTTFIKLIQQQGLNTNLEAAAVNCKPYPSEARAGCSLYTDLRGRNQEPWCVWVSRCVRGRRREWCVPPHPLSPPLDLKPCEGPRQQMRALPAPLCCRHAHISRPSEAPAGAPGHRLRINETSNYIHLLQGSVPSDDPPHFRVSPPPSRSFRTSG